MTEKEFKIYQDGIEEGKKHTKTSPQTEREYLKKDDFFKQQENCKHNNINPIMNEIKEIKTDIKTLSKEFSDFKIEVREMPYKMKDRILEETDKLYATKDMENKINVLEKSGEKNFISVSGLVADIIKLVIFAVAGAVVALIIK